MSWNNGMMGYWGIGVLGYCEERSWVIGRELGRTNDE
jgi:hypothetical protein